MSNPPRKNAEWDEGKQRWHIGHVYYMPDKTYMSPWCWYNFEKDEVVAECCNPEAEVLINVYE